MPYNDPESDDPMVLNGVAFVSSPATALEAAYVFAEELARLGQSEQSILDLFRSPEFRGPHSAWLLLGADRVTQVVRECCETMTSCRAALRAHRAAAGEDPCREMKVPL